MPVGYSNPDQVFSALTLWFGTGLYLTILFMLQAWRMEKMDEIDIARYRFERDPVPALRMNTTWKVLFIFFAWTPLLQFCAALGFTCFYLWMGFVMKQNLLALPPKYARWNRELKATGKAKAETVVKALQRN